MVDHVHVSIIHDITYIIVYIRHLYSAYLCISSLCQCMAFSPYGFRDIAWIVCYKKHPPYEFLCTNYSHNERVASWDLPISFYFYTKKDRKRSSLFLFIFEIRCCLLLFNTYGTPDCQMCQQQLGTFLGTHTR